MQEQERIIQEQEQSRLAQLAQEEERQRLIQANTPFKSRRLKNQIKGNISKAKEDILSKSKSKLFTITDREGKKQKKQVISRPLSKLEEVSNSSNESS